jgi:hypothetical protein
MVADERRKGGPRGVDPFGRVAEHVDRPRRQVGAADALGQDEHPGARLGGAHGRGQAGDARTDHHRVVGRRRRCGRGHA